MTSILFLTEAIISETKNLYSIFFLHFLNLVLILNIFKKKMTLKADVFLNFWTRNRCLDRCLKSPVSEDPSTSNMVNEPKHCSKLDDITFTIFIDPCDNN